jgi:F-type H+-transporting ATPase subunit b
MQSIGHQLGDLFLQAVPTVVIILLFYFILRAIFFKPLLQVMAEREARTIGAQKAAEAAQTAAAEKVGEYQESLKQARGIVYAEQEAVRNKLLEERANQVKEARTKATEEVNLAKQRVAGELAAASIEVKSVAGQLSAEIAQRLLPLPPRSGSRAGQAR